MILADLARGNNNIVSRISLMVVSTHLAEAGKLQATNLKPLPGQCHCCQQPHC